MTSHHYFPDRKTGIIAAAAFLGFMIFMMHKIPEQYEKRQAFLRSFNLNVHGEIMDIKEKGTRDFADVTILVKQSNKCQYEGEGPFGGKIELANDTLKMELMFADCLLLGDSVIIGPADNYQTFRLGHQVINFPTTSPLCPQLD